MILSYNCVFGVVLPMNLTERFGDGVELQALEFVNALPIEWRLVSEGTPTTEWQSPMPERKTFPFHDLQVPHSGGTRGTSAAGISLETRGIGGCIVLVWLREGTYRERSKDTLIGIG